MILVKFEENKFILSSNKPYEFILSNLLIVEIITSLLVIGLGNRQKNFGSAQFSAVLASSRPFGQFLAVAGSAGFPALTCYECYDNSNFENWQFWSSHLTAKSTLTRWLVKIKIQKGLSNSKQHLQSKWYFEFLIWNGLFRRKLFFES